MCVITDSGVENYYGSIQVKKIGDNYYLQIENYDCMKRRKISKTFYEAFVAEFSTNKNKPEAVPVDQNDVEFFRIKGDLADQ